MAFHFIGSEDLAIGFRFVGVPGTVVTTAEEAREAFHQVTRQGEAKILVLSEEVTAMIPREVLDWQMGGAYPLIVEVPGLAGHQEGRTSLVDSIRDAVGIHV
ncbi:MAG TPA: V-type ATP synthase subunit F [Spirochaetia bacterium]|nr:V-type ATP synthase subunit F [Spirochaetia bacterium]